MATRLSRQQSFSLCLTGIGSSILNLKEKKVWFQLTYYLEWIKPVVLSTSLIPLLVYILSGLDWGGVSREFFELVCIRCFDPNHGLFMRFKEDDPQALVS